MGDPINALVLERMLAAPRAAIFRCWTEPDLLMQWFCPKPWQVSAARIDALPGGEFFTVMNGPKGERHENPGVFLEVARDRRLVFTDAFTPGRTAIHDSPCDVRRRARRGDTLYRPGHALERRNACGT